MCIRDSDNAAILKTDAILQVKGCSTHRRSLYLYEYFVDFYYSRMKIIKQKSRERVFFVYHSLILCFVWIQKSNFSNWFVPNTWHPSAKDIYDGNELMKNACRQTENTRYFYVPYMHNWIDNKSSLNGLNWLWQNPKTGDLFSKVSN